MKQAPIVVITMSDQMCTYCAKECKSSDSKPFPNSKSKDRIHNRCHLKKSLADKQQRTNSIKGGGTNGTQEKPAASEQKITSGLDSLRNDLIDQVKRDEERMRAEANAQKLNRMMTDREMQANKDSRESSFFFDIKAGVAKPHEKRQFLHHRNICEIAPRYNDHGYLEEATGRAYDHSGKDLNTLGDDSDDDAHKDAERRKVSHSKDSSTSKRKSDINEHQESGLRKVKKTTVGVKVDERNPCWFCLSSPKVEKHLILAIGDHCYLTLAKGGLTDDHLLLIPIEHIQSVHDPANSPELLKELDAFKRSLVEFFQSQSKMVVFFERNFRSVHWQIQVVPITCEDSASPDLADKIKLISEQHFGNSSYIDIPSKCSISDMIPPSAPYLYWQIEPSGHKFVSQIELRDSFFPVQLPRIVLADKQIMDCRDRVDWKKCTKSHEEYVELIGRIKEKYREYDITA